MEALELRSADGERELAGGRAAGTVFVCERGGIGCNRASGESTDGCGARSRPARFTSRRRRRPRSFPWGGRRGLSARTEPGASGPTRTLLTRASYL